jgi:subtilisin family serine protease
VKKAFKKPSLVIITFIFISLFMLPVFAKEESIMLEANGAKVINMSFGSDGNDPNLEVALNDAYNSGITLVAASGNDSRLGISYPAKYANVIAVGSVNSSDIKASTSNYGPELDVVAPGVSILSSATQWSESTGYTKNFYTNKSGTSLAAPHVSGLASLILSTGDYSPSQIKDKINSTADKVSGMNGENRTDYHGYGRINVSNSLSQSNITRPHMRISPSINPESNYWAKYRLYRSG